MEKKFRLLLLLALLLTAATGAWADEELSNKIWQPSDKFNIGEAWFYFDDTDNGEYYQANGNEFTVPQLNSWSYYSNYKQWATLNFINYKKKVKNGTETTTSGSQKLWMTAPEGKRSADFPPVGFKIVSGAGTKESPYKFGLVYELPLEPYTVTLAEGTEDADKWTVKAGEGEAQAFPVEGLKGGEKITATYSGEKKVKSVKAVKKAPAATDLATITADYEAKDGETLTGTLASNVKISIADGATVTLKDVNITNLGDNCDWAGINCPGDATLVLEGTNTVCAGRDGSGYNNYPGIWIASGKTLTIQGDGTLTAYSNGTNPYAAGIGGCCEIACGNIVINSGTITATGGWGAAGIGGGEGAGCGNITINGGTVTATGGNGGAGIGSGGDGENYGSCGNITISGGTVEATGGSNAAGIGGGSSNGACGTITITSGVASVKATKGEGAPNSIGKGNNGQDITVNIEAGANVTQK